MSLLAAQLCPTVTLRAVCSPPAPLSLGFSRQEYLSELPFPFPGDLPDPGIEPGSLTLQADALLSEPTGKPKIDDVCIKHIIICSNIHSMNSIDT